MAPGGAVDAALVPAMDVGHGWAPTPLRSARRQLNVLNYLDGTLAAPDAARALRQRALMDQPEALLAYLDRDRAYALAYTWGRDRLLAGLGDRRELKDRSAYLSRLMTSSEWDLGRQQ